MKRKKPYFSSFFQQIKTNIRDFYVKIHQLRGRTRRAIACSWGTRGGQDVRA